MIRKLSVCCWACWLLLWPSLSTAQTTKYDLWFRRWGAVYFPWHDWRWWKSQAVAESTLNPQARSACGALGLMQLMPKTAAGLGVKNPYDPEANIQGGIHYDAQMWAFWRAVPAAEERRSLMFASYNAGPGNISRARKLCGAWEWALVAPALGKVTGKHSAETLGYVQRIRTYYAQMAH